MITVSNVSLQFGGDTLFKNVNLQFNAGNCYGVIGANGAGKSTFLKILCGVLPPTTGEVTIPKELRMSVLKQDHFAYDAYTVLDTVIMGNERLYAIMQEKDALYAKPDFSEEDGNHAAELEAEFAELNGWEAESDVSKLLQGLGLSEDLLYQTMGDLSGNEKVKILLAQALFGNPDIILMDEPTNGMDIPSKSQFRKVIASGMNEQKSIVISTHQVRDLENMIDHITILDNGLLLLDADTHTISSRLRFIKGGNESEIAGAFYKVSTIAGYSAILPNETDEESLIDIEMLFNCTIGDPEVIHNIFNSSAK